jgi:2-dehydro-3-deoxyglucarate aldolase
MTLSNNKGQRIGAWVTLEDTFISEIFSKSSNIDFVCIDNEHTTLTSSQIAKHIQTISLSGKIPFVRTSKIDEAEIKMFLDVGAKGIIAPQVKSIEDIDRAKDYMFYPPRGKRGTGVNRAHSFGKDDSFSIYKKSYESELEFIPMIENKESLENLEEIVNHELVNTIMIGPYDLSSSLGKSGDFQSQEYLEALEKIESICTKYDISPGIHIVEPDQNELKNFISKGYRFIVYSVDFRILESTMNFKL